ncbi:hypothetical protein R1sor_012972 [Riccia sorocarpa]|uniref:Uncharacterized protein n=1 Tax=Riccia sorocarpa TaxID=122646 RepID=A0ABD3I6F9_9MARC
MATVQDSIKDSVDVAEENLLPREAPVKLVTGHKLPNTECWLELNKILHAMLTNHVARKASLTQGSSLLRTASTVFTECSELKKMRTCCSAPTSTNPHHAPLFGVVCGLLGTDAITAQRSYLFMGLRDILSAATRLNLTGPLEAAKLQHQIAGLAETLLSRYANRTLQDSFSTCPLIDIFQGAHDQLFSRMFCS